MNNHLARALGALSSCGLAVLAGCATWAFPPAGPAAGGAGLRAAPTVVTAEQRLVQLERAGYEVHAVGQGGPIYLTPEGLCAPPTPRPTTDPRPTTPGPDVPMQPPGTEAARQGGGPAMQTARDYALQLLASRAATADGEGAIIVMGDRCMGPHLRRWPF